MSYTLCAGNFGAKSYDSKVCHANLQFMIIMQQITLRMRALLSNRVENIVAKGEIAHYDVCCICLEMCLQEGKGKVERLHVSWEESCEEYR